jgi:hypothetical protein
LVRPIVDRARAHAPRVHAGDSSADSRHRLMIAAGLTIEPGAVPDFVPTVLR